MNEATGDQTPSPAYANGWKNLWLTCLILTTASLGSSVWVSLSSGYYCGDDPFNPLPLILYKITYDHGYLAGVLVGGLLIDLFGLRRVAMAAAAILGVILLARLIFSLQDIGCALESVVGLSIGLMAGSHFKAVAGSFPPDRRALPLLVILYLPGNVSGLIVLPIYYSDFQYADYHVFAVALLAGVVFLVWKFFRENVPPVPSGAEEIAKSLSTVFTDKILIILLLIFICSRLISDSFVLFVELWDVSLNGSGYMGQGWNFSLSLALGTMSFLFLAAYLRRDSSGRAWKFLLSGFAGLVILPMILGLISYNYIIAGFNVVAGACLGIVGYLSYLLLVRVINPRWAGTVGAAVKLLSLYIISPLSGLLKNPFIEGGRAALYSSNRLPEIHWLTWMTGLSALALLGVVLTMRGHAAAQAMNSHFRGDDEVKEEDDETIEKTKECV